MFVGVVTALATWVAAVLLGVLSPGAAPPMATAVAIVVVLVLVVILGGRVVFVGRAPAGGSSPRPPIASRMASPASG